MAEGEFHPVAKLSELKRAGRKRISLNDRIIALFYVGGSVYAMDHFCYRKSARTARALFTCVTLVVSQSEGGEVVH